MSHLLLRAKRFRIVRARSSQQPHNPHRQWWQAEEKYQIQDGNGTSPYGAAELDDVGTLLDSTVLNSTRQGGGLGSLGEQPGGESLGLGDSLDFYGDGVDGLL